MPTTEIIDSNKLIAEFMGADLSRCFIDFEGEERIVMPSGTIPSFGDTEPSFKVKHLAFNGNWNWIMAVVNKIIETINSPDFDFQLWDEDSEANTINHFTIYGWSNIILVYESALDFIKWHNEHKNITAP